MNLRTYEPSDLWAVTGSGLSNEFHVNIGLKQGSALSPLLFIFVMELISRKISTTDALRKIMYADELVIVVESIGKNRKAHWRSGMKCLRNMA